MPRLQKSVFVAVMRKGSDMLGSHLQETWKTEPSSRIMLALMGVSIVAPTIYMAYAANYVYKECAPAWEEVKFVDPDDVVARQKALQATYTIWDWYRPWTWRYPPKSWADLKHEKERRAQQSES